MVIAIALACNPKILIADEPTTALDVTIQAQILELMKDLQNKIDTSIIFITHDLDEALRIGDRIALMKDGNIVQVGRVDCYYHFALNIPANLFDSAKAYMAERVTLGHHR